MRAAGGGGVLEISPRARTRASALQRETRGARPIVPGSGALKHCWREGPARPGQLEGAAKRRRGAQQVGAHARRRAVRGGSGWAWRACACGDVGAARHGRGRPPSSVALRGHDRGWAWFEGGVVGKRLFRTRGALLRGCRSTRSGPWIQKAPCPPPLPPCRSWRCSPRRPRRPRSRPPRRCCPASSRTGRSSRRRPPPRRSPRAAPSWARRSARRCWR